MEDFSSNESSICFRPSKCQTLVWLLMGSIHLMNWVHVIVL